MKKNKMFFIIPMILIIEVIVLAIIFYFSYYANTQQLYKRLVIGVTDSFNKKNNNLEYNTVKSNILLNLNVESANKNINIDILELIDNLNIKIESQVSKEEEIIILDFESKYNKKDLLNLRSYTKLKDRETFLCLKDFLNRYFKIEINEKFYASAEKILKLDKNETENNIEKIKNELVNIIKPENCFSSKEEIEIDGIIKKVQKDTLQIELKEIIKVIKSVYKEAEKIDESKYNNTQIEFNIYTTGLFKNNVEKIEIKIYNLEENLKIDIIDGVYYFEFKNKEIYKKGNIRFQSINENKGIAEVELEEDFGRVNLKLEYVNSYNSEIDKINVDSNKIIDKLLKQQLDIVLENFKNSELYSLIEKSIN